MRRHRGYIKGGHPHLRIAVRVNERSHDLGVSFNTIEENYDRFKGARFSSKPLAKTPYQLLKGIHTRGFERRLGWTRALNRGESSTQFRKAMGKLRCLR